MTNYQTLNHQDHARLRMLPAWENAPNFIPVVVSEFAAAASVCPILFTKDTSTGAFFPGAMFGFKPEETALKEVADRTGFLPLNSLRDGFFILDGRIVVDRANPRFGEAGERLFDDSMQPTPALEQVQRALGLLRSGNDETAAFVRELTEARLIEPIDISLSFDDGERLNLQGLYTVSLDALRGASDAAIVRLFRADHLQFAYAMIGSLKHIATLANLRNRRLAAGA